MQVKLYLLALVDICPFQTLVSISEELKNGFVSVLVRQTSKERLFVIDKEELDEISYLYVNYRGDIPPSCWITEHMFQKAVGVISLNMLCNTYA